MGQMTGMKAQSMSVSLLKPDRTHVVGILMPVDTLAQSNFVLADTLWISLQSQQDTQKMGDEASLPCVIFLFLVDFPCARFQEGQPGSRVS